jgi:hypothetical protein
VLEWSGNATFEVVAPKRTMDPDQSLATRLPYRLQRVVSRQKQFGCNLLLAVVLGGVTALGLSYAFLHPHEENIGVLYAAASGFGIAAAFRFVSVFRLASADRASLTVVELSAANLRRGETVRFFVQQKGPLSLESLRASLAATESVRFQKGRGFGWKTRPLANINFFDSGPVEISETSPFEHFGSLEVPLDAAPTLIEEARRVWWTIEIAGNVNGLGNFQNAYRVQVV